MKLLAAALVAALTIGTAAAQDFPVTVTHEFGETTIPAKPERIVSVGLHEQDFLYALGIAPVGVHEWWGDYPYATWPWAEAAREAVGATPEVLMGFEINIEWVAAQRPDLIVASYYGDLSQETYDLLSQIAPTITAPPGYPSLGRAVAGRAAAHRGGDRHRPRPRRSSRISMRRSPRSRRRTRSSRARRRRSATTRKA